MEPNNNDELVKIVSQLRIDIDLCNVKIDNLTLQLNKKAPLKEWSVESYSNNSILIKFSFNEPFKSLVKDLGGKWISTKKGWMFSVNQKKSVCESLTDNFGDWAFTEITI
jgi:hypothetical protein